MAHNISMLVADLLGAEAGNVAISNTVTRSQDMSRMLGIALVDNVNYFFKEQTPSQYRIEAEFFDKYGSIFKSPKRVAAAHFENKVLSLYEFYEASSKCAYADLAYERTG